MPGWHRYIHSMPYFPQGATIPTDTPPRLFSMHISRRVVRCYEPIMMEGSGLLEEHPVTHFRCIERVNWCFNQRTVSRACGLVKRQTGSGYGNSGVTVIDRSLAGSCRPTSTRYGWPSSEESRRMRECTFHVPARRNSSFFLSLVKHL